MAIILVLLHRYLPFDPSVVLNKLPSISTEIPSEESGLVIAANTVESMRHALQKVALYFLMRNWNY